MHKYRCMCKRLCGTVSMGACELMRVFVSLCATLGV